MKSRDEIIDASAVMVGLECSNKQRIASIDLLRVLCSLFVIIEHFCEKSGQNGFGYAELSTSALSLPFLLLVYSLARVAVPVFVLLSGYCSINSTKAHVGKVIELAIMVICYSTVLYIESCTLGEGQLSLHSVFGLLLPKNYYVYLYLTLYILSPYINVLIKQLSKKQYKSLICILLFMFVGWSTLINTVQSIAGTEWYGVYATGRTTTDMGFTICLFMTCYLVGGYIKKYSVSLPNKYIFIGMALLSALTTFSKIFFPVLSRTFFYYDSIFVISQAIFMVLLFVNINVKQNKILSYLAKNTLGVYLIHSAFLGIFVVKYRIDVLITEGVFQTMLALVMSVASTYVCSLLCSSLYDAVVTPLMKKLNDSRIGKIRFLPENE